MVVDEAGRQLTQRECPAMGSIPATMAGRTLQLGEPGGLLQVEAPGGRPRMVRVWEGDTPARDAGDAAADWLTRRLGRSVRLVWQSDDDLRPVDAAHAEPGDVVSLADGFAVLVASRASVEAVAEWTAEPADARRFRPNLVVSGVPAFAEDHWRRIRIGAVVLELVKPCSRCVMVNLDPQTQQASPATLLALAQHRRSGSKVVWGWTATVRHEGLVREGDPVEIVEVRAS
jgi:uncharacterized protein YcbX